MSESQEWEAAPLPVPVTSSLFATTHRFRGAAEVLSVAVPLRGKAPKSKAASAALAKAVTDGGSATGPPAKVRKPRSTTPRKPPAPKKPAPLTRAVVHELLQSVGVTPIPYDEVKVLQVYNPYKLSDHMNPPFRGIIVPSFTLEDLDACPTLLDGLIVATTGTLQFLDRVELRQMVERAGGLFQATMGNKVNLLVVGDDSGPSKVAKARSLATPCVDDAGIVALIRTILGAAEPEPEPAPETEPEPEPEPELGDAAPSATSFESE